MCIEEEDELLELLLTPPRSGWRKRKIGSRVCDLEREFDNDPVLWLPTPADVAERRDEEEPEEVPLRKSERPCLEFMLDGLLE